MTSLGRPLPGLAVSPGSGRAGSPVPWRPLAVGLLVSMALPTATLATEGAAPFVGPAVYGVGALAVAARWRRPVLGVANAVTLVRLVAVSWVAALLPGALRDGWSAGFAIPVGVLGAGALLLDGVDGRVARSHGGTSAFGGRFDLETDAALVLVLSTAVAVTGVVGWWVLAIGGMRYAFLAGSPAWPWLRTPLPPRLAPKVVGVAQVVALLAALLSPLVPGALSGAPTWILTGALAALVWSFGRDARLQWAGTTGGADATGDAGGYIPTSDRTA